ncbi:MAG: PepSY domain-containing protein [Nanoarchaeota archaeon]
MVKMRDKIILVIFAILLIGINGILITALKSNNKLESHTEVILSDDYEKEEQEEDNEYGEDTISFDELGKIDNLITEEEAKEIALERIGKGNVTDFESEREGKKILYNVEIDNEVEVEVDAENGDILEVEWEDDD